MVSGGVQESRDDVATAAISARCRYDVRDPFVIRLFPRHKSQVIFTNNAFAFHNLSGRSRSVSRLARSLR